MTTSIDWTLALAWSLGHAILTALVDADATNARLVVYRTFRLDLSARTAHRWVGRCKTCRKAHRIDGFTAWGESGHDRGARDCHRVWHPRLPDRRSGQHPERGLDRVLLRAPIRPREAGAGLRRPQAEQAPARMRRTLHEFDGPGLRVQVPRREPRSRGFRMKTIDELKAEAEDAITQEHERRLDRTARDQRDGAILGAYDRLAAGRPVASEDSRPVHHPPRLRSVP